MTIVERRVVARKVRSFRRLFSAVLAAGLFAGAGSLPQTSMAQSGGGTGSAVTCPLLVEDWLRGGAWPVPTVSLGARSYDREAMTTLLSDATLEDTDASVALGLELLGAKLNIARGTPSTGATDLIGEADSRLAAAGGALPLRADPSSDAGREMVRLARSLEAFNGGELTVGCAATPSPTPEAGPVPTPPPPGPPVGTPIVGFADLHTHMFAEYAYPPSFIWGTVDVLGDDEPAPRDVAMPRCSGLWDHAVIRPGYLYGGLGLASEMLTMVGDISQGPGAVVSDGDAGLHLKRRNGYDTRVCLPLEGCVGSLPCRLKLTRSACDAADPGYCADSRPDNVSISALVACNLKLTRDACDGSGYCGSRDSSVFGSVADDINACWTHWPNCDAGDMCIQHTWSHSLTCSDLDEQECSDHGSECDWGRCRRDGSGSLTCSDLSSAECSTYSRWCQWDAAECQKKTGAILNPFQCNDLSIADCRSHGECRVEQRCRHDSGSLTCSDLSQTECGQYSQCRWRNGRCRTRFGRSLQCNDLTLDHCGRHSECHVETRCRHSSGSLTCSDLSAAECDRYTRWCRWDPADCSKKPWVLAPFECNDLIEGDCARHSECSWSDSCWHPLFAPGLQCRDLSQGECLNHELDGCRVRDCVRVDCHWEDWGDCRWDSVWPPRCGQHFEDWPSWDTPTHQQHWWGYLQDAHRKGLRIASVSILEAHPFAKLMPGYHEAPYAVIMRQLRAVNRFAEKHQDWAEIALSPEHARSIIASGKLAVVVTVEAEFPFCKSEPCGGESWEDMLATLDEYEALGARGFQIVSHFDNPFAGTAAYQAPIHTLQWFYDELLKDGEITEAEFLGAVDKDWVKIVTLVNEILSDRGMGGISDLTGLFPIHNALQINDVHVLLAYLGKVSGPRCIRTDTGEEMNCNLCLDAAKDAAKETPPRYGLCENKVGLTDLGRQFVGELMKRRMLIDLSHLSTRGVRDIAPIVNPGGPVTPYPVYVSHGDPREALREGSFKGPSGEKPSSDEALALIAETGGMFGQRTGADEMNVQALSSLDSAFEAQLAEKMCQGSSTSFQVALAYLVNKGVNVGFGLDMNGMAPQSVPRFRHEEGDRRHYFRSKDAACLGDYGQQAVQAASTVQVPDDPATPYTNEADLNWKGLGHVGLVGAFVDDLRNNNLPEAYMTNLQSSAENYLRMWERARAWQEPTWAWTEWFDRDDPSSTGDWETRADLLAGRNCDAPAGIEAAAIADENGAAIEPPIPSDQAGEVLEVSPAVGLVCRNSDQPDGLCKDYRVRFLCPVP